MQRPGMLPCRSRSARLAQIDEGDIGASDQSDGRWAHRARQPCCRSLLARPIFMLDGPPTSIIFGSAVYRFASARTYSLDRVTCRRGLQRFSSPMVETVSPFVVVRRE